jgi:O-succinylbenzoic acid--CoA ligase
MEPVYDIIRDWSDESRDSFPVKTSGSTVTPKLILHSRAAMTASAHKTCDFFGLEKGDALLLPLPAATIGGKMMIVRAMVRGLRLICVEPKSDPLNELFYDKEIKLASFTPMQMITMIDHPESVKKLSHITQILLGGGEVSDVLKKKLQSLPSAVYESYGMTETISHIALKKLNGENKSDTFTLLDGIEIQTDDRGCLVITAPHLSAESIVTNDIVNIINDRQFKWLGRYDNVINSGGVKISAEEVERKLRPYISEHFFIIGTPHETVGQQVTLVMESKEIDKNTEAALSEIFAKHLDKYEKPRSIIAIEKFVYTESGKVNKVETTKRRLEI